MDTGSSRGQILLESLIIFIVIGFFTLSACQIWQEAHHISKQKRLGVEHEKTITK